MANKALATRQKMRLTAPLARPRNPVALAAKQRAAGPHAKDTASRRQAAKRALAKAKLSSED